MSEYDAVVIGAGIAGMYQLYSLRQLGLTARVFEAGSNVGGTWYWNRYPGARFDSESYSYQYSFSEELLKEWDWSEHFAAQPETLSYLNFVADKFDLRKDIEFNARVKNATYDSDANKWNVVTEDGRSARATYLITCVGILSAAVTPSFPGREYYNGLSFHTYHWPKEPLDLTGKRVAVVGTGATGVQVIQEIAKVAGHLTVLQKEPSWCKPLRNSKITREEMEAIRASYPKIFARCRTTVAGFLHDWDPRDMADVSQEEREARFEELYQKPGFPFWHNNFKDLATNLDTARAVGEFLEMKIRERVNDPNIADKLIPRDHPFGTRRVAMETNYYEVYNQNNVELIDVNEEPIERFTEDGLIIGGKERKFDIVVFATGFDAVRGAFDRIDFRGVDGITLRDKWKEGPITYMGMQIHGFPNLFTIVGAHNLSTFCNVPRCIEQNVEFVTALLRFAGDHGYNYIDPTVEAEEAWTKWIIEIAKPLLLNNFDSWFTGINHNVEGRRKGDKRQIQVYSGGQPYYIEYCRQVVEDGYRGYEMKSISTSALACASSMQSRG